MTELPLRMPAEWEPQDAVWLAWPHNREDWPGKFEPIPWVMAEIIRHLCRHVRIRLLVKNEREQNRAITVLERVGIALDRVDLMLAPTNRIWLRDSGPTFAYRGKERVLLDWKFNAWAKYSDWKRDDQVPRKVANFLSLPRIQPRKFMDGKQQRIVLEGGSIDVNGKGTLLTTEECLLSDIQCRNPGFSQADYEAIFREYLGVSNVIWLANGIVGDDTHGHIDDLARFANESTVVIASEQNPGDANYALLKENRQRLRAARDQDGRQLNVVELPMPKPVHFDSQRLPASYVNFLISNGIVLVPTFNDVNDRIALNSLSALFPNRDVIGIYCGDFVWGLGTLHCASQQEIADFKVQSDP